MKRRIVAITVSLVLVGACSSDTADDAVPDADQAAPAHGAADDAHLEERWRWRPDRPGYIGMPAADDDGIAVTYGKGRAVLLDHDGRLRWEAEHDVFDAPPLLMTGSVVVPTDDGVISLARDDGRLRWTASFGDRVSGAAAAAEMVVAATWDGLLIGLDRDTGTRRWDLPLGGSALGAPVASGGLAVASWDRGIDAGVVAVDAVTGRVAWRVPVAAGGVSGPRIVPGDQGPLVVVATGDATAVGINLANGALRWQVPIGGRGSPEVPPASLPDGVVVGDELGGMRVIGADGTVRWGVQTDGAAVRGGPVAIGLEGVAMPLDDGRLVVAVPGRQPTVTDPEGRISGLASGPDGTVVMATREAETNAVIAYRLLAAQ